MLTIACVLKSGGIYDASWVTPLKNGVARHLPIKHRFVCLSDVDVPCERIPLEHDWPGWWSKLEALKLDGPLLYFDLDTAIVGDLTDMAAEASTQSMIVLQDFYRLGNGVGSGVMGWRNDLNFAQHAYGVFATDPESFIRLLGGRGDQGFLEELELGCAKWQNELPGQIVSYKVHCRNGIPPNARVVALHGRPKFADMPANDPVRVAWEMAA